MNRLESGNAFVRYRLGDLDVVALRDGYVDMPTSRLRQQRDEAFAQLPEQVPTVEGMLRLSVNAFLVIDNGEHVLIDTGAADSWDPSMGELAHALDAAGVAPERITTVALTHTHRDHVNGLVAAGGVEAFPNLDRLYVPRNEVSLFDGIDRVAGFRGRRVPIDDGFRVSPAITAISAHGHEVGHTVYQVSSAGQTLLIWGDIVHVPSIQFQRPELTWEFDADQDAARQTRSKILRRAARPGVFVAGAHLDSPGVGTILEEPTGYRFTAL